MESSLEAVVIADDLTGAADTGVQFTAVGTPVYLMPAETRSLGNARTARAAGLSLYTASRHLSAEEAAGRLRPVASALTGRRPGWLYKKVDSCLRGNLGAEIDVLLDFLGLDAALVAPALPAQGRITVSGIHLVHGRPLADTEFAKDPLSPVASSTVAHILASQSRYSAGRIHLQDYGDTGRLQRALQREVGSGHRLIVCDAAEQAHLDQIAELVIQNADRLLPVGSAGLAASLVGQISDGDVAEPPRMPTLERLLLVCGTGSKVTRRQLDALLDKYPGVRHELEPAWLIDASVSERSRCAAELCDARASGILALTIGPLPPGGPAPTPEEAAAGLAALARLAVEIIGSGQVEGLFLSGGETADAFLRASRGEAIALERELLPGLALGRWVGGLADALPVVTKAGAFGQEQTLVALYERISAGRAEIRGPTKVVQQPD